ncbi:MAG: hypothetical protein Ct9H300mP8_07250 [Gammaproteobacteria bacterium]|nr:MAG: hypothetical protein Ct9H300mP8_07250 [Gammaproteobacteria bacterium]
MGRLPRFATVRARAKFCRSLGVGSDLRDLPRGVVGVVLYCLPTVAIAVPYYQRGIPFLRLSTSLVGLFGDDIAERPLGRFVDFVFIIALVGGTGTSLGLATPMIGACIGQLLAMKKPIGLTLGWWVFA